MKRTLSCLMLGAALVAVSIPGHAQRMAISQVRAEPANFTVYLDAIGEDGKTPLAVAGPAALRATYGKKNLVVEGLAPFREGVGYIVLVDVSASLGPVEFKQVREALQAFTAGLRDVDRMALIRFGDDSRVLSDFTASKDLLQAKLKELRPADSRTAFHLALKQGLELGRRLDGSLPIRRAIVVLTDGKDEGSGITIEDVLGDVRKNRTPVYAIGFSRLPAPEKTRYFDVLRRLATESGGEFFPIKQGAPIGVAYDATKAAITRVYVAKVGGGEALEDGRAARLQVTLTAGDRVLTDGLDVRVPPAVDVPKGKPLTAKVPPQAWYLRLPLWAYSALGTGIFLTIFIAAIVLRRKPTGMPTPEPLPAPQRLNRPEALTLVEKVTLEPPPILVKLVVVRGQKPGATFDLTVRQKAVVGHAPSSDLTLPLELTMSPQHFELLRADERLAIRDLGSGQGTSINGVPIHSIYPVCDGDTITAGATVLRIVTPRL